MLSYLGSRKDVSIVFSWANWSKTCWLTDEGWDTTSTLLVLAMVGWCVVSEQMVVSILTVSTDPRSPPPSMSISLLFFLVFFSATISSVCKVSSNLCLLLLHLFSLHPPRLYVSSHTSQLKLCKCVRGDFYPLKTLETSGLDEKPPVWSWLIITGWFPVKYGRYCSTTYPGVRSGYLNATGR